MVDHIVSSYNIRRNQQSCLFLDLRNVKIAILASRGNSESESYTEPVATP